MKHRLSLTAAVLVAAVALAGCTSNTPATEPAASSEPAASGSAETPTAQDNGCSAEILALLGGAGVVDAVSADPATMLVGGNVAVTPTPLCYATATVANEERAGAVFVAGSATNATEYAVDGDAVLDEIGIELTDAGYTTQDGWGPHAWFRDGEAADTPVVQGDFALIGGEPVVWVTW